MSLQFSEPDASRSLRPAGCTARRATMEHAPCNTTWPTTERFPKIKILWLPAKTTSATPPSRPTYQGQLAIDETSETRLPDNRFRPLRGKSTNVTNNATDSSATGQKRPRYRAQRK